MVQTTTILIHQMLDNIITSAFTDILLHVCSSMNVKLFKTHSKRFHS